MAVQLGARLVPDPIKAMEMMNQLNLGYGNEPEFRKRSMDNNPRLNPEKAAEFRQALETEKEANRVLKEMKRDQAIEKAREFVKEGKSASFIVPPSLNFLPVSALLNSFATETGIPTFLAKAELWAAAPIKRAWAFDLLGITYALQ